MIPIDVRSLFPLERAALLGLLTAFGTEDWSASTVCPGWSVRDVTAHLVNDYLRRLSGSRDGHAASVLVDDETLPTHLGRINNEFVLAMRQCSPAVLIDLLTHLGPQLDLLWAGMELNGPADLNVSWAGPGTSPAWLDIAREYTEHWVHQQQIRDATSNPGADTEDLLRPVVVTFLHAMPVALRDQLRAEGTTVGVQITGAAGGHWAVVSNGAEWNLTANRVENPQANIRLDQDTLWRVGSRGISVEQALQRAELQGDTGLANAAAGLLAVVA